MSETKPTDKGWIGGYAARWQWQTRYVSRPMGAVDVYYRRNGTEIVVSYDRNGRARSGSRTETAGRMNPLMTPLPRIGTAKAAVAMLARTDQK